MKIVLLGTARDDSNTFKAIRELSEFKIAEVVQLHELIIQPYFYGKPRTDLPDDFLKVINLLIA